MRMPMRTPMWPPGTKNSYHAQTVGFLAGEIVRRAAGMSLGRFLATRVLQLGLIFVLVTIATLALTIVAHAIR